MVAALFLSNIVDPSGAFQNFLRVSSKGRIVNLGESVGQVVKTFSQGLGITIRAKCGI